jgi:GNAT superfamily N-acetyltransferase
MNKPLDIRTPSPTDVPELGRICYEAFATFQKRRDFEPDFPNPDVASGLLHAMCASDSIDAFAAYDNGKPIGSNFLIRFDDAAGVGPITVDPDRQSAGAGRALMQTVIDAARKRKIDSVRLMQDAHNPVSLSLYAKLGFDVDAHCAFMVVPKAHGEQKHVRGMTDADTDEMDRLCKYVYGISRKREVEWLRPITKTALVYEQSGRIRGYVLPFLAGHLIAEDLDVALSLIKHAGAIAPENGARVFVPTEQKALFRAALEAGCKVARTMNLMSLGTRARPQGVWGPGVFL